MSKVLIVGLLVLLSWLAVAALAATALWLNATFPHWYVGVIFVVVSALIALMWRSILDD